MKLEPPLILLSLALVIVGLLLIEPKDTTFRQDWEGGYQIIQQSYLSGNTIAFQVVGQVRATLSAYNSVPEQTDSTPFITASGQRTRDGIVAANWLEMGTTIRIDDKYYQVQDRMNKRYGFPHIDIWMSEVEDAKTFGRQNKIIEIIK